MTTRPLQFLRRGQPVALGNVPPDRTCWRCCARTWAAPAPRKAAAKATAGACTVVLGEADGHGKCATAL